MGLRNSQGGAHERTPLIPSPRDEVDEAPETGLSIPAALGVSRTSHRKFVLLMLVALACVGGAAVYVAVVVANKSASPTEGGFANGALATDAAVCSQIGVDILKRGGAHG